MTSDHVSSAIARLQSITTDVDALRRSLDEHDLALTDRQYLSRCFELLSMELGAVSDYLRGMSASERD
ncbi:MAG: hypothetical protein ACTHQM_08440 [Thermoanaerobaculia bacterium]